MTIRTSEGLNPEKVAVGNISNTEHLYRAGIRAVANGFPVGFVVRAPGENCLTEYFGFGGLAKAFEQQLGTCRDAISLTIGGMKSHGEMVRDFFIKPPILLTTRWSVIRDLVDWSRWVRRGIFTSTGDAQQAINYFFENTSFHPVLPIKESVKSCLPFSLRIDDLLTHAFMWLRKGSLTPMVQEFERYGLFYATSANLTGMPTIQKLEDLVRTFPQVPLVLIHIDEQECARGISSPMADLSGLPTVRLLRLRDEKVDIAQINKVLTELGISYNLDESFLQAD